MVRHTGYLPEYTCALRLGERHTIFKDVTRTGVGLDNIRNLAYPSVSKEIGAHSPTSSGLLGWRSPSTISSGPKERVDNLLRAR